MDTESIYLSASILLAGCMAKKGILVSEFDEDKCLEIAKRIAGKLDEEHQEEPSTPSDRDILCDMFEKHFEHEKS